MNKQTIVVLFAVAAAITWFVLTRPGDPRPPDQNSVPTPGAVLLPDISQPVIGIGYDTPFVMPGVQRPPALPAADAAIPDDAAIIGVQVDDRARAYLVSALSGMTSHVVNDVIGTSPVSVTYCDQTDCARVFTKPGHAGPIDLKRRYSVNRQQRRRSTNCPSSEPRGGSGRPIIRKQTSSFSTQTRGPMRLRLLSVMSSQLRSWRFPPAAVDAHPDHPDAPGTERPDLS